MIHRVEPLTVPDFAVICGRPIAAATANPELLIVARVVSEELQVTEGVTSEVLPSLNVPIAENC
jgi:hypothetical protein